MFTLWSEGFKEKAVGKVGLTTLGQPRLSEGAQPYPIQRSKTQRETGDRKIGWGI